MGKILSFLNIYKYKAPLYLFRAAEMRRPAPKRKALSVGAPPLRATVRHPAPKTRRPRGGRPMPSAMQAQDKGRYPRKQRGVPGNQPGGGGNSGCMAAGCLPDQTDVVQRPVVGAERDKGLPHRRHDIGFGAVIGGRRSAPPPGRAPGRSSLRSGCPNI